jgi:hypothetical protein
LIFHHPPPSFVIPEGQMLLAPGGLQRGDIKLAHPRRKEFSVNGIMKEMEEQSLKAEEQLKATVGTTEKPAAEQSTAED